MTIEYVYNVVIIAGKITAVGKGTVVASPLVKSLIPGKADMAFRQFDYVRD